jgi:hypothetical protein
VIYLRGSSRFCAAIWCSFPVELYIVGYACLCFCPSTNPSEDRNRSRFRHIVFSRYLEFRAGEMSISQEILSTSNPLLTFCFLEHAEKCGCHKLRGLDNSTVITTLTEDAINGNDMETTRKLLFILEETRIFRKFC